MKTARGIRSAYDVLATKRRAVVLVIVLVVIVVLSLAAYAFTDLMLTHRHAAITSGKRIQARMLVDSGVEAILSYLTKDEATREQLGGHYDNPLFFQNSVVIADTDPETRASFSVLAPLESEDGSSFGIRYGLEDESNRLNLNLVLLADQFQDGASRTLLMAIPGMTEFEADAILDWMDEDEDVREYGAELEAYAGLQPAYGPRNGPMESIEELLLVQGILPELVFGVDMNRNGMADANEMSMGMGMGAGAMGAASVPAPSASTTSTSTMSATTDPTGMSFNRGWSSYLTMYSAERNLNVDGLPRIYLNGDDMQQLYDDLTSVFSEEWATFIVAYRIYGPYDGNDDGEGGGNQDFELDLSQEPSAEISQVLDLIGARVQVGGGGGGAPGGDTPSGGASGGGAPSGGAPSGGAPSGGGNSRGGDDEEEEEPPILESPFDPVALATYMPTLMDNVTVMESESIPGRLNINQAAPELLLGIPGITEEIVEGIVNSRTAVQEDGDLSRNHETWILSEGIVTLDEMKTLMPFITAGGDVFRAQIVGYFHGGGPSSRVEVIIDASSTTPRVLFWRDVSHLGRGFALETLGIDYLEETQ